MGLIGDATGGLGDKLTAISDKIIAAVPGIEQPVIEELHADITALVQAEKDAISQAGGVIQADLAPVVEQLKAFNTVAATLVGLLQQVRDGGLLLTIPKATV